MADLETTYRTLTRVHPRSMQVLLARFVAQNGRTRADFARFYGVDEAAAKVMLLRAAREFASALADSPAPPVLDDETERAEAERLDAELEGPALTASVEHLKALTTHAEPLRTRLAAAERAELSSPQYARETWLRRLAIVAVLALSAWFGRAELLQWLERLGVTFPPR